MELSPKFIEKLETDPQFLKEALTLASKWIKINSATTLEYGPQEWKAGNIVELTTKPLLNTTIDEIVSEFGLAAVKEKAIAYLKGFITAISIMG